MKPNLIERIQCEACNKRNLKSFRTDAVALSERLKRACAKLRVATELLRDLGQDHLNRIADELEEDFNDQS